MKDYFCAVFLLYCFIMWVLCIVGITKAIYEYCLGIPVFAADWLLLEIPYTIIFPLYIVRLEDHKDPIYKWLHD